MAILTSYAVDRQQHALWWIFSSLIMTDSTMLPVILSKILFGKICFNRSTARRYLSILRLQEHDFISNLWIILDIAT